jgi:AraC family transcriptional regulator
MLPNSLSGRLAVRPLSDTAATMPRPRTLPSENARRTVGGPGERNAGTSPINFVSISPQHAVVRHAETWRGTAAEIVQATSNEPVEFRFNAPVHLLIAYEQGVRRDGETFVESLPRSTLHDVTRKLTFVPAGHEYRESQHPRVRAKLLYFYIDPDALPFDSAAAWSDLALAPRLFFEDASLWNTAIKLKRALEDTDPRNEVYVEALGCVLAHELVQLDHGRARKKAAVRGGLASWQHRMATTYIEEHLVEPISLATLAALVRLSPYYFCRSFKQSLGMPPHRYHMSRRIERAKMLLAEGKHSVTEIGLTLGYRDASAFTSAFRRITGVTPSEYRRTMI